MFSYYYNYLFFFCNYELLVVVCFFSFLFFLLISDKGSFGSYLHELSQEARSKFSRHLDARENMIHELSLSLDRSVSKIRKIVFSFASVSFDILFSLQHIVKKLSSTYSVFQVKYRLDAILLATKSLELQIRLYLTRDLLAEKEYSLSPGRATPRLRVL